MIKIAKTHSTHVTLKSDFAILLFYKYIDILNPAELMEQVRAQASKQNMKGRVIIATEGVNGTLEGTVEACAQFAAWIKADSRFADMHIKTSEGYGDAFPKLSVKVRPEIVTLKAPHLKPHAGDGAKHLEAEELHTMFENGEDFVVLDMRNGYEYDLGHFEKAVKIPMRAFKEMHDLIPTFDDLKDKKVVAVCTGGVRCEKGTALLREKGFKNVYQLFGGIHTYMEKFPKGHWLGSLYTFDRRTTMDFAGDVQAVGTCFICQGVGECMGDCSDQTCVGQYVICAKCHRKQKQVLCDLHVSWVSKLKLTVSKMLLKKLA